MTKAKTNKKYSSYYQSSRRPYGASNVQEHILFSWLDSYSNPLLFLSFYLFLSSFQLAGAGILGVGIWVKVDSGSVLSFLGKIEGVPSEISQVLNVGYLLIALGGLLVIIGFLGCCGAIRESKCMLLLVRCCLLLSTGLKVFIYNLVNKKIYVSCVVTTEMVSTMICSLSHFVEITWNLHCVLWQAPNICAEARMVR